MNNSTESYTETIEMQFAQHIIWRANEKLASLSIVVVCYEGVMVFPGVLGNGVVIYVCRRCQIDALGRQYLHIVACHWRRDRRFGRHSNWDAGCTISPVYGVPLLFLVS
jgi:hypothetical protein